MRTLGILVLVAQFLVLAWWSERLVDSFSLSFDFAFYQQGIYQIAHGNLNPHSTIIPGYLWQNLGEFIFWPLAIFERIWPHPVTLKLLQDAALVGAELVALLWACDIVADFRQRGLSSAAAVGLIVLAVLLAVLDPWTYRAAVADVHNEPFGGFFLILAARDIHRGRRSAWLWAGLTLLCGVAETTYVACLGVSAVLSGRRRWRQGVGLVILGGAWMLLIQSVHAVGHVGSEEYSDLLTGRGLSPLAARSAASQAPGENSTLGVLAAAVGHPNRVWEALWQDRYRLWGSVSPAGLLGILWLPVLVPVAVISAETALAGPAHGYSMPGYQTVALAPLLVVGSVALVAGLAATRLGHRRYLAASLAVLLALNVIAWFVVWAPKTHLATYGSDVPARTAAVLKRVSSQIRPGDEVIAAYGLLGGFADRRSLYETGGRVSTYPVRSRRVWIIVAPEYWGYVARSEQYADIEDLASIPGMHMVADSAGVWAFRWTPRRHFKRLTVRARQYASVPGWTVPGPGGTPITTGPVAGWHVASNHRRADVLGNLSWNIKPGAYSTYLRLDVSGQATVEVRDLSDHRILAHRQLDATDGAASLQIPVHVPMNAFNASQDHTSYPGDWPWVLSLPPASSVTSCQIEVAVRSSGAASRVSVYSVRLAPGARPPDRRFLTGRGRGLRETRSTARMEPVT